jgi:hypothetical protein
MDTHRLGDSAMRGTRLSPISVGLELAEENVSVAI